MSETPEAPTPQQPDATPPKRSGLRALRVVLVILGIVALLVGFMYLSVVTGKLPSFLGKIPHGTTHRLKRGYAGVLVGAVLLLTAFFIGLTTKKQRT